MLEEKKEVPQEEDSVKSLLKKLIEISDKSNLKDKDKKTKLPLKATLWPWNLKQGYATVCYINENKNIDLIKVPIEDSTLVVKELFHEASAKFIMTYRNKPFIILPSWSTKPFSPEENLSEAETKKQTTIGQRYIFNKMKIDALIAAKKKISGSTIVIGLIVIGVIGYFLTSGGFL